MNTPQESLQNRFWKFHNAEMNHYTVKFYDRYGIIVVDYFYQRDEKEVNRYFASRHQLGKIISIEITN